MTLVNVAPEFATVGTSLPGGRFSKVRYCSVSPRSKVMSGVISLLHHVRFCRSVKSYGPVKSCIAARFCNVPSCTAAPLREILSRAVVPLGNVSQSAASSCRSDMSSVVPSCRSVRSCLMLSRRSVMARLVASHSAAPCRDCDVLSCRPASLRFVSLLHRRQIMLDPVAPLCSVKFRWVSPLHAVRSCGVLPPCAVL